MRLVAWKAEHWCCACAKATTQVLHSINLIRGSEDFSIAVAECECGHRNFTAMGVEIRVGEEYKDGS